jgi:hypothetical protein
VRTLFPRNHSVIVQPRDDQLSATIPTAPYILRFATKIGLPFNEGPLSEQAKLSRNDRHGREAAGTRCY